MKTEKEFLQKIVQEMSTIEYGEGREFNLRSINKLLRERLNELRLIETQTKKNESLQQK